VGRIFCDVVEERREKDFGACLASDTLTLRIEGL